MTPNPPDEALHGGNWRPFLGPRSSSSERLQHVCMCLPTTQRAARGEVRRGRPGGEAPTAPADAEPATWLA
eukprot:7665577-Alexandrium_andersonii.AAC.1